MRHFLCLSLLLMFTPSVWSFNPDAEAGNEPAFFRHGQAAPIVLAAYNPVNVGTSANDGTGDGLRTSMVKINANFVELYANAHVVAATAKTTPVDADLLGINDSAASNALKQVTWANAKATLKTYFDTQYATSNSPSVFLTTSNAGLLSEILKYENTTVTNGQTRLIIKQGPGQVSNQIANGGDAYPAMLEFRDKDGNVVGCFNYRGEYQMKSGYKLTLDQPISGFSPTAFITVNSVKSVDFFTSQGTEQGQDESTFWNGAFNFVGSAGTSSPSTGYGNLTATSGRQCVFSTFMGFLPTSGTADFYMFNSQIVINQTGGANGKTAAYVDDNIVTAAADYRSFWSKQTSSSHTAFRSDGDAKVQFGVLSGTGLRSVWADSSGKLETSTVNSYQGSGTPEGSVTAPVGSTFHRTDGGAATSFYVKESGSGNTGWVAK